MRQLGLGPLGSLHLLVEGSGLPVELGTLLAGDETGELQGLPGGGDSLAPLADSAGSEPSAGVQGLFLGNDLAALGLPEVLLGETTGGPLSGALPDLPLLADLGDLLGLPLPGGLLLGSLLGSLLGGPGPGPLLGGGFLGSFSGCFSSGHCRLGLWCWFCRFGVLY